MCKLRLALHREGFHQNNVQYCQNWCPSIIYRHIYIYIYTFCLIDYFPIKMSIQFGPRFPPVHLIAPMLLAQPGQIHLALQHHQNGAPFALRCSMQPKFEIYVMQPYLHNICTIFAQYLHNICIIFAHCVAFLNGSDLDPLIHSHHPIKIHRDLRGPSSASARRVVKPHIHGSFRHGCWVVEAASHKMVIPYDDIWWGYHADVYWCLR